MELALGQKRVTNVNPMGGRRGREAILSKIMKLDCFGRETVWAGWEGGVKGEGGYVSNEQKIVHILKI